MRRRDFITALGSMAATTWPLAARAQQPAMPVVGFLHPGSPAMNKYIAAALRKGLAEAGYVEGRNVTIESRWANNQLRLMPELAADLVGLPATVCCSRCTQLTTCGDERHLNHPDSHSERHRSC